MAARENSIRSSTSIAGLSIRTQKPAKKLTTKTIRYFQRMNRRSKKRLARVSILTANLALLIGVGLFVVQSTSGTGSNLQSAKSQFALASQETAKPLDELSSADVAVHIARVANLPESVAVVNKADTVNAQLNISSADDQLLAKPQIVSTALKSNKDIKNYKTAPGDTVSSIASKFGVTPDTIRFSNNLRGDAVAVGTSLIISPVNGITYVVKAGDTPDAIAERYHADKQQLIQFNDAELAGAFKTGETIVVPDAVQPAAVRTASYGGTGVGSFAFGGSAIYGGNGYDYGWCTWHAANRRIQIGRPLPTNLGNAISWVPLARQAGLATGRIPQAGAVFSQRGTGGLGHVGFVEKVNADGSFLASDMNYPIWGQVTYRTITPAEFGNYTFIY
jgi:surface antigen